MNILKQEGAYSLSIDKDGKAVFTVGDVSVTSKEAVNDGTWKHIAGIREKNGSLKFMSTVHWMQAGMRKTSKI